MKIKMELLEDILYKGECGNSFVGYTTTEHTDINGTKYELLKDEARYFKVAPIVNGCLYATEDYLMEVLLSEEIDDLQNKRIFEHGYPESRLIPANFYKECLEAHVTDAENRFIDMVDNILNDYA